MMVDWLVSTMYKRQSKGKLNNATKKQMPPMQEKKSLPKPESLAPITPNKTPKIGIPKKLKSANAVFCSSCGLAGAKNKK